MGIVSPFAAVVQPLREGAAVLWMGGSVGAWAVRAVVVFCGICASVQARCCSCAKARRLEKRRAHQSRGFDRLFSVVPSSRVMMDRLADQGANLGAATSGLLQLLDRVGADTLERAVSGVVARDQLHLRAVHHEIDRLRFEAGLQAPLTVAVTPEARANVHVRTHSLSTYDRLHVEN